MSPSHLPPSLLPPLISHILTWARPRPCLTVDGRPPTECRLPPKLHPVSAPSQPPLHTQPPSLAHSSPTQLKSPHVCSMMHCLSTASLARQCQQFPAACLHFQSLPNDHRWLSNRDNRLRGCKIFEPNNLCRLTVQRCLILLLIILILPFEGNTLTRRGWNRMGIGRAEFKQSRSHDSASAFTQTTTTTTASALVPAEIYETLSGAQDGALSILWRIHHTFFFLKAVVQASWNWKYFLKC